MDYTAYHPIHGQQLRSKIMTKYKVMIRGTVTKTIEVEANDAAEAEENANEMFNLSYDGRDEQYEQDSINTEEVVL